MSITLFKNTTEKLKSNMKNFPIRKKLFTSFMAILILGCLASGLGLIFIQVTNASYKSTLKNYGFAQGDIAKLGIQIQRSRALIRDILLVDNSTAKTQSKTSLDSCNDIIHTLLPIVEAGSLTSIEKEKFDKLSENLANYEVVRDRVVSFELSNKHEQALSLLQSQDVPLMNEISANIDQLLQSKIDTATSLEDKLNLLQVIATIIIIFFVIFAYCLTLYLSKYINSIISKPIEDMEKVAKEMSKGNLDVSIEVDSKDEVGQLANSFSDMIIILKSYIRDISHVLGNISNGNLNVSINQDYKGNFSEIKDSISNILESLNEVFLNIKEATCQVNAGSQQVASTAQVLSQGSTDQACAVEELSASMAQINGQVQNTATNANTTNTISLKLVDNIEKSNSQMKEMLVAMTDIEKSSSAIKNIINAIDDIAEQTNLLALNAAIEAARAGDSGKGFAVVAEEVRNLSNQSLSAAKQTAILIQESMNSVNRGRNLADSTAESLLEVVENVKKSTVLVSEITLASDEQAQSIKQVNSGILEISDVVQSNSATAEESAAASEELMAQAETLNKMIEQFKLR